MTSHTCQRLLVVALLAIGFIATGCLNRDLAPAEPSTQSGVLEEIHQTGTTKVDILFVVDNSNSMAEEQAVLADQIVVMARELISPTTTGAPSVQDLHIGIVTTDMGTHGYTIQTCPNPSNGDNGVLQNAGRLEGCEPTYSASDCDRAECPWLVHNTVNPDDGTDPANPPIWDDFSCVATLGTGGCGFEQQLEASYMALVVNTEAGRPNDGFLRNDSLLAIVYVTDEDDCSTDDAEMFNPSRDDYGPLNVRCALQESVLYPISRYHDAFVDLRGGSEDRVVVAAITGVPIDGSWNPGDPIDRLRELRQVNPSNPNELLKSCDTPMGAAYPPVRIAELVYSFGNNGILSSICQADWTPALQAITRKIQDKLGGVCVERPLASSGADACRVIETLIDDRECPHLADQDGPDRSSGWHLDLGTVVDDDGVTRRRCEILPSDYDGNGCPDPLETCAEDNFPSALQGWFYDNRYTECANGQVRFTSSEVTSDESDVRFECLTALCPVRRQCAEVEAPLEEGCRPYDPPEPCGDGQVRVQHVSEEYCGWNFVTDESGAQVIGEDGQPLRSPCSCARCSDTIGSHCDFDADIPNEVTEIPLYGNGGCCAEGFHCENGSCVADRTNTDCE